MTGELTLTGRVLPIGGVKEKVLGASRSGIKHIILPMENEADMEDIPEEVRESIQIHLVETLEEVIQLALLSEDEEKPSPRTKARKGSAEGGAETGSEGESDKEGKA